jgi:hypothetical protein
MQILYQFPTEYFIGGLFFGGISGLQVFIKDATSITPFGSRGILDLLEMHLGKFGDGDCFSQGKGLSFAFLT